MGHAVKLRKKTRCLWHLSKPHVLIISPEGTSNLSTHSIFACTGDLISAGKIELFPTISFSLGKRRLRGGAAYTFCIPVQIVDSFPFCKKFGRIALKHVVIYPVVFSDRDLFHCWK